MEKFKIAFLQTVCDETTQKLIQATLDEPTLPELFTPVVFAPDGQEKAFSQLKEGNVDALVVGPTDLSQPLPEGGLEVVASDELCIMPLATEPTADDVVRLRDILERDFDQRSPRIAIVQETAMKNPELASNVTAEQGINTYGPYTIEQILAEDTVKHFDGIIFTPHNLLEQFLRDLSLGTSVRFLAGQETVVTGICLPTKMEEAEEGLTDVSWLTHPFFVAIDIIRSRRAYDQARRNVLPKLFHDRREKPLRVSSNDITSKRPNDQSPES